MMKKLLIFFLLFLSFLSLKVMAYEEATYNIVYQNNIYEIRDYNERLAVQVNHNDQNRSFQRLFKYISGSNIDSKKINMTTPVTESKKISMTTPVIQSNENNIKIMQFFLPSKFTINNAPKPSDKDIKLVLVEQGYYAVIKYSGRHTDKNFNKYSKILKDRLSIDNIEILSLAIKATYNSPFTLPFLRRNEAMYHIVWNDK